MKRGDETLTLKLVLLQIVGLSVKLWEGRVSEGGMGVEPALLTDRRMKLLNQWEPG